MSQSRLSPSLRYRAALLYRRGVLIERAERLYQDWRTDGRCTDVDRLRRMGEELHLISWEIREIEKQLPNVARMI